MKDTAMASEVGEEQANRNAANRLRTALSRSSKRTPQRMNKNETNRLRITLAKHTHTACRFETWCILL